MANGVIIIELEIARELIQLVKPHAILYKNRNNGCNLLIERRALWNEIANKMNQISGVNMRE